MTKLPGGPIAPAEKRRTQTLLFTNSLAELLAIYHNPDRSKITGLAVISLRILSIGIFFLVALVFPSLFSILMFYPSVFYPRMHLSQGTGCDGSLQREKQAEASERC